jgi:hypothetical protein
MQWVLISLLLFFQPMLVDFGESKDTSWYSVNDTVMGGRSSGTTAYKENALLFQGSVSFENNGGFASVRSPYNNMDLSEFSEVTIRYRCEGQSLNFSLERHQQWYLPNYKVVLPSTEMEWKTETFSLNTFQEYKIGRPTGKTIPPDALERIIRFGFMTNDKKEGPFQAEIDFIQFK